MNPELVGAEYVPAAIHTSSPACDAASAVARLDTAVSHGGTVPGPAARTVRMTVTCGWAQGFGEHIPPPVQNPLHAAAVAVVHDPAGSQHVPVWAAPGWEAARTANIPTHIRAQCAGGVGITPTPFVRVPRVGRAHGER